ncbi:glycosyltransferase family 2 protein [Streptococcus entericus]|uniref:glycosyltransferase family 2 protein n=1 Tax=Streptococcus entericus TaxID=155680 RepID=UPI000371FC10|nr:glycosyltransferase [Streptococcus entericus]
MSQISVILPVYNVENYLMEMLDSIVSQTIFSNLEILLIDDGSSDNSLEICRAYEGVYKNIKVFHQENGGVSTARNKGLDEATAPYVMFLDADDKILPDMCESLLTYISSEQADLAITDFSFVTASSEQKKHSAIVARLTGRTEILISFLKGNVIENTLCDKIFRRDIISSLRMQEGYAIGEDMFFVFEYLLRCKNIFINTEKSHYRYIIREDSAMTSPFSKKYIDAVTLSKRMETMVGSSIYPYAQAHTIYEIAKLLGQLLIKNARHEEQQIYRLYLSEIKNYPLASAYRYLDKKQFISILLLKISPLLYLFVWKRFRGY